MLVKATARHQVLRTRSIRMDAMETAVRPHAAYHPQQQPQQPRNEHHPRVHPVSHPRMAPRATALASTLLCVCAATASQQQPPLADLTLQSATAPTLPPPLCFEPPAATPAAALSRRAAQDASGRPVWTGTDCQDLLARSSSKKGQQEIESASLQDLPMISCSRRRWTLRCTRARRRMARVGPS